MLLLIDGVVINLWAQEYTHTVNEKTTYSIVQNVDNTTKIVCNNYDGRATFIMFTDASTTASTLIFDQGFSVSDFIIKENFVFFCGKRENTSSNEQKAIFGYYNLSTFPNSTVYYYTHDDYVEFHKIESYTIYSASAPENHIVMTAKTSQGSWNIVDSYEGVYNRWLFYSLYLYSTDSLANHEMKDIAITDSYVIATSEHIHGSSSVPIHTVYTWWFTKPHVPNGNMFAPEVKRCSFSGRYTHNPVVEQCGGNRFVIAYGKENSYIVINEYNGVAPTNQLIIPVLFNTYPLEMKMNPDSHEVDMLVYSKTDAPFPFTIPASYYFVHVPLPVLHTGGTLDAHLFQSHIIHSFDYINTSNCYIASGEKNDIVNVLKLYKYKYNFWGDCTTIQSYTSTNKYTERRPTYQESDASLKYYWRYIMQTTIGEADIFQECNSNENKNQ